MEEEEPGDDDALRDKDILYYDHRGIVEALDKTQSVDLSKHLYSAHLMHRDFYLRNYKDLLPNGGASSAALGSSSWCNQPKYANNESRFPHASYVNWPFTGSTNSVKGVSLSDDAARDRLNHQVRTPRTNKEYVNLNNPMNKPLTDAILPNAAHPVVFKASSSLDDVSLAKKRLQRAAEVLIFELDAAYQRQVHKQVFKMDGNKKKSPVIDPAPSLGPQAKTRIFKRLTRLLDENSADSAYSQRTCIGVKPQWKEFLAHEMCTRDTLPRCRRLFIDQIGRFGTFEPLKLDNQYLSLLDCSEWPIGKDKNTDIKKATYYKLPPVTDLDLLEDALVPISGDQYQEQEQEQEQIPPEYHKTYSVVRKSLKNLQKSRKRLAKMKKYRSIAMLDDRLASGIERDSHDWSSDPQGILYGRPSKEDANAVEQQPEQEEDHQ